MGFQIQKENPHSQQKTLEPRQDSSIPEEITGYKKSIEDIEGFGPVSVSEEPTSPGNYRIAAQHVQDGRRADIYVTGEYTKEGFESYGFNIVLEDSQTSQAETWAEKISQKLD